VDRSSTRTGSAPPTDRTRRDDRWSHAGEHSDASPAVGNGTVSWSERVLFWALVFLLVFPVVLLCSLL
jgi:hypothetical protein